MARTDRRPQDLFGLSLELRLSEANRHHGGQAGEDVILVDLVLANLERIPRALQLHLLTEDLEQGLVEASDVRAALRGGNDVDEELTLAS